MSDNTKIEWTDATWNTVTGCRRVDEGCRNCYAEVMTARFSKPGQWGEGLAQIVGAPGHRDHRWTGQLRFNEHALTQPLRWKRPRMIFVNSTSDMFQDGVLDEWIDRQFAVMALCPQHTFQVLTKRPERARDYLTALVGGERFVNVRAAEIIGHLDTRNIPEVYRYGAILPNVWLGTSVSDQTSADLRIPPLLECPAAVRFISAEPLLGPVDISAFLTGSYECAVSCGYRCGSYPKAERCEICGKDHDEHTIPAISEGCVACGGNLSPICPKCDGEMVYGHPDTPYIDWVICGGESGPHARPMHPDWARSLRDQCVAAGVPFFFKQWGEWAEGSGFKHSAKIVLNDGRVLASTVDVQNPQDRADWSSLAPCLMRPEGKRAAGRTLDGVTWDQMPGAAL